jgi:hypothetical protein
LTLARATQQDLSQNKTKPKTNQTKINPPLVKLLCFLTPNYTFTGTQTDNLNEILGKNLLC